ncbi:MAG: type II toxin-antitoxin system VapB family antitoxin [Mariprofundaceae bacterium]|nr:type II toxin-antitoxin system VapB family antitoxin [Mariprofundaceae bacterium]
MATAKVFKNGNSQAVRLPKAFNFDVNEVEIVRRGDDIILHKKSVNLAEAFKLLADMPLDFFADGRCDPLPEDRQPL